MMDTVLDGSLGIERAKDIWRLLKERVDSGHTVTVRWENITSLDTSVIQILIAAKKAMGKKIVFCDPPPFVAEIIRLSGTYDYLIP